VRGVVGKVRRVPPSYVNNALSGVKDLRLPQLNGPVTLGTPWAIIPTPRPWIHT